MLNVARLVKTNKNVTPSKSKVTTGQKFKTVKNKYKTKNNLVGIDVSKWQEDIDFKKVKKAGVDFVMIRVGYQSSETGKNTLDDRFEENIKGFIKEDIPVGIYFYSLAKNKKEALKQAEWVENKIKKYKITMPIAFDFEDWSNYTKYHLSFYHLTEVADTFLDYFKNKGYDTLLYSSKYYLDNIWLEKKHDIWLAHYVEETTYENYKMWQVCEDGIINGIEYSNIDIDVFKK